MDINYDYIKQNYDYEILAKDIVLIKNFITDDDLKEVLNHALAITEEG
jgi:hypothetical protein